VPNEFTLTGISSPLSTGGTFAAQDAGTHISSHVIMFSFRTHAEGLIREAMEESLLAAAEIVKKAAEKKALEGMKGGAWVGMSPEPLHENIGVRLNRTFTEPTVEIGTHVMHGLYWELGHQNLFLRRYVRNNWLTQALFENMKKVVQAIRGKMREKSQAVAARKPAIFVGTRTFLYTAGKYLADLNAIFQFAGFYKLRAPILKTARVLGDVNAFHRGMLKQRLARRIVGRQASQGLLRRIKHGGGNFPVNQRLIRRYTGARMARLWSIRGLDHRRLP
jgi:hypothetical protein